MYIMLIYRVQSIQKYITSKNILTKIYIILLIGLHIVLRLFGILTFAFTIKLC